MIAKIFAHLKSLRIKYKLQNVLCQVGGWAFVCPCVQKVQRLPLALMTLVVSTPRIYTVHGVPLSVTGIAQVKITSSNEEMLRAAVEQFIDKTEKEIQVKYFQRIFLDSKI